MEKEDPDEVFRRRAQFIIYKTLEKADALSRRRPSVLRIKICKLKIRFGKRLKKLRKSMVVNIYAARLVLYKRILNQLKALKFLFSNGGAAGDKFIDHMPQLSK
ncbi:hypothetical protein ACFE04_020173 [Oxalis oulophora]